jgi:hypothetical protein
MAQQLPKMIVHRFIITIHLLNILLTIKNVLRIKNKNVSLFDGIFQLAIFPESFDDLISEF